MLEAGKLCKSSTPAKDSITCPFHQTVRHSPTGRAMGKYVCGMYHPVVSRTPCMNIVTEFLQSHIPQMESIWQPVVVIGLRDGQKWNCYSGKGSPSTLPVSSPNSQGCLH